MIVDVHAHLDDNQFSIDIDEVIERAKKKEVIAIINNGLNQSSNEKTLELSKKYDIVRASLGLYPTDALQLTDEELEKAFEFIIKNKQSIVSIGECGLDYLRQDKIDKQKEIFQKLIEIAKRLELPIIVHSRSAENDVIESLEKSNIKRVILHCFCGDITLIKKAERLGYYFSVPPSIVTSSHFQNLVKEVSMNHLLTESDSPYLGPDRNIRNEPSFIEHTIAKISEIRGLTKEEVEKIILMNYKRCFFQ